MEAEEDLSAASRPGLADDVSSVRSATAGQQCHAVQHHQQQWLPAGDMPPMPSTCSVALNHPTDGALASPVGACAPLLDTATAFSFDGAAVVRLPAGILASSRAGSAAQLPAGSLVTLPADAATVASACNVATTPAACRAVGDSADQDATLGRRGESKERFRACTPGEEWWMPQSEPDAWSEWEERAGVVSRVLQVLRCEGLLREARKALQGMHTEAMTAEADVCPANAEREASEQQGRPTAAAAPATGGDEMPPRGCVNSASTKATKEAVVLGAAAADVDRRALCAAVVEADTSRSRALPKEGAVLAHKDTGARAFQPSTSPRKSAVSSDVVLSSLTLQPSCWQQLETPGRIPMRDMSSSRARVEWQLDQETVCVETEVARRSVWMRGERSENDLQDDCKIKALRALIPTLLAIVPEWLDSKLDTGRRGEWLGFEKVVPCILRQRFGFNEDELHKDGPFCWKGSRRTSTTEVSTLLLASAFATQDSGAATRWKQYSKEVKTGFVHRPQAHQQEHNQQQLHLEARTQQFPEQCLHPDALPQWQPHQPHAQQLVPVDQKLSTERVPVRSTECCGEKQQFEECHDTFEAMEVDEDSGERSAESGSCRCASDTRRDFGRDSCNTSKNGDAAQPTGSRCCDRQGSYTLRREAAHRADPPDDSAVVLEVMSLWVNGFQESGKPYDVHVQARVDGHTMRDVYIEIKATVATHPCFVLSLRQLEFARRQGPDNYLYVGVLPLCTVLVICSIRAASPAWVVLDNVAERVARCLPFPLPPTVDRSNELAGTTPSGPALPSDLKIKCHFKEQATVTDLAARGQLTEQSVDDILGCLLKSSP